MSPSAETGNPEYRGWAVGGAIILAIFVIAAVLWFHYHPF